MSRPTSGWSGPAHEGRVATPHVVMRRPLSRALSRLLPIAAVLALIVGCVSLPMTVLASPIVAQSADAPAGSTPPSTAPPPGPPKARPSAVVLTFENADIEMVTRSEEHTSELQSHSDLVCRLLLEKKKKKKQQ